LHVRVIWAVLGAVGYVGAMRLMSSLSWRLAMLAAGVLALGSPGCAAFLGDASRDARVACDKKDGSSCFVAGNLVAEKAAGPSSESIRLYAKGCAARHAPSCDALGDVKGALREEALAAGCKAGDQVSCAKRASELGASEQEQAEARAIRHGVCQKSTSLSSGSPAREVEGVAEACAALARMVAAGQGGGRDDVAAARLDVLAQTLRNEALYRHEREDDAKVLPQPAEPPRPPRKGIKPKVDPGVAEREKFHRDYAARRAAREAWIASVQASLTTASQQKQLGDPSLPQLGALDRAASVLPRKATGSTACQSCVESCGSMSTCAADDFAGGRCAHLRCGAGEPCPAFDACVGECTAKADTCVKGCGECAAVEATKGTKP
jgi:hypothetical protein